MEDFENEIIEYFLADFWLKTQDRTIRFSALRTQLDENLERYPELRMPMLFSLRDLLIDSSLDLTPLIQVGAFTDEHEKLGHLLDYVNELIKALPPHVVSGTSETSEIHETIVKSKSDFRDYQTLHDLLVKNEMIDPNPFFSDILNSKVDDNQKKTVWKSSLRNLIILIGEIFGNTHGQIHEGETIDQIANRAFKQPGNVEFEKRSLQDASRQAHTFMKYPHSRSNRVNMIYTILEQAGLREY